MVNDSDRTSSPKYGRTPGNRTYFESQAWLIGLESHLVVLRRGGGEAQERLVVVFEDTLNFPPGHLNRKVTPLCLVGPLCAALHPD